MYDIMLATSIFYAVYLFLVKFVQWKMTARLSFVPFKWNQTVRYHKNATVHFKNTPMCPLLVTRQNANRSLVSNLIPYL